MTASIQDMASAIRFLALDSILNAGEGHQGVPLDMAEIAATLYARHLKVDPTAPLWPDRDRVVLSNGHGSMLLYALLHLSGYAHVPLDALKSFRRLGSVCAGHPEIEQDAGIEITSGLLGQGIACAVGMAAAEARLAARFGPDLVDHRTWAFVGDGCFQEGIGQEAISLAGHLQLGKQYPQLKGGHIQAGNVWEWVSDRFGPSPETGERPERDPEGPATGYARVQRGGSYLCHVSYCDRYHVHSRTQNDPDSSAGNNGFRVAASA